jgi:tRNA dimethylallyltransferase
VALVGTTATGKTALALALAERRADLEVVSVDSMAVYREMDVATAKPSREARQRVPHHLIDVVDPAEEYTVARYRADALAALWAIEDRGHRALLVGGTGLYLRALVDDLELPGRYPEIAAELWAETGRPEGLARAWRRLGELDPVAASRIEPGNRRRVVRALEVTLGSGRSFSSFGPGLTRYPSSPVRLVGLPFQAAQVDQRIAERFDRWRRGGLLEEVRKLAGRPAGLSRTARQAVGYRELLRHVEEGADLERCFVDAERRTRVLARRQWAWFRRDPRIVWLDPAEALAGLSAQWDASEAGGRRAG